MTNREQLIELAGRTVYEADPETRTVWPAMNVHDPYANPREEAVAWEDVPTKLSELTRKQYLYPGEVLVDAGWRPPPECDGSERCTVTLHTHGCLSDYGDCDDPTDHDLDTRPIPVPPPDESEALPGELTPKTSAVSELHRVELSAAVGASPGASWAAVTGRYLSCPR